MELLTEVWLPVLGYEGRYEISSCGRVKSLPRYRRGKSGCLVPVEGRIMRLTPKKRSASGRTLPYLEVRFRNGGPRENPYKCFLVHRLVAQAFVGELFEGAQVDHIDGDHANNAASNLRILSAREHGLLHPCFSSRERHAKMQAAAQETIKALRAAGKIVGRHRVET